MKRALLLVGLSIIFTATAFAAEVKLAWDPPKGAAPTGYKIYYGETYDNLPETHVVEGTNLTTTVTGLTSGKYYFFRCVALHGTNESKMSPGVFAEAEDPSPEGFHAVTE